ncbi:ribonuclease H protein [Trifolium medium]|uniref:Ribonuclease H protein n=1 Tax=Trifolium medium TaxID=97028 RepID=A0A392PC83_9FABA|nr:ribonuclease H protein [Trifolium medium]
MKKRKFRTETRTSEPWGRLWKVQAPPKAKHLMWRICKECLPTQTRLRDHHVQCQIDCPLCLEFAEDDWHLFFDCEGSKEAWSTMGLDQIIQPRMQLFDNAKELIFDVCKKESKYVAGQMAMLLWMLWHNRNNMVWNEEKINARDIGCFGSTYME